MLAVIGLVLKAYEWAEQDIWASLEKKLVSTLQMFYNYIIVLQCLILISIKLNHFESFSRKATKSDSWDTPSSPIHLWSWMVDFATSGSNSDWTKSKSYTWSYWNSSLKCRHILHKQASPSLPDSILVTMPFTNHQQPFGIHTRVSRKLVMSGFDKWAVSFYICYNYGILLRYWTVCMLYNKCT